MPSATRFPNNQQLQVQLEDMVYEVLRQLTSKDAEERQNVHIALPRRTALSSEDLAAVSTMFSQQQNFEGLETNDDGDGIPETSDTQLSLEQEIHAPQSPEQQFQRIRFGSQRSTRRFACVFKVLRMIHELLELNKYSTKRDLYYTDVDLFEEQSTVDDLIDDLAAQFGVTRSELHVVASSRGILAGNIQFKENGELVDGMNFHVSGKTICPLISNITDIDARDTSFVLVLEKDALFSRLLEDGFIHRYRCALVTSKGYPDVATRQFLHKLSEQYPRLPIFCLTDWDSHGIEIAMCYSFGALARMAHQRDTLTCPTMRWLGLDMLEDFHEFGIPQRCLLKMTAPDRTKAKRLLGLLQGIPPDKASQLSEQIGYNRTKWIKSLELMVESDVHCICGYIIARVLLEKYFHGAQRHSAVSRASTSAVIAAATPIDALSLHGQFNSKSTILLGGIYNSLSRLMHDSCALPQKHLIAMNRGTSLLHVVPKKILHEQSSSIIFKFLRHLVRLIPRTIKNGFNELVALFTRLPFETRFVLLGICLGNLPDIDVLVARFFGGRTAFHRTLTHSVTGNAIIVPLVALLVQWLLGGSRRISYGRALQLTALCSLSHLVTDFFNNYGIALFSPWENKHFYSLGLTTVFDFQSVVFFYSIFEISRRNIVPQRLVALCGIVAFLLLVLWKRAMLSSCYAKVANDMKKLQQQNKNSVVWLHPSTWHTGRFYLLQHFPAEDLTIEKQKVQVERPLGALLQFILTDVLHIKGSDPRTPSISKDLGMLAGPCSARSWWNLNLLAKNPALFFKALVEALPTVGFVQLYWSIRIVLALYRAIKRLRRRTS